MSRESTFIAFRLLRPLRLFRSVFAKAFRLVVPRQRRINGKRPAACTPEFRVDVLALSSCSLQIESNARRKRHRCSFEIRGFRRPGNEFRMPCEGPGFRLIQRPIWSGKFELHAHTSRRTVEVARAAGGVFPRSAGRPSLAIRTVALGGPKADPVGIARAPLSFRALASRAKLSGANWPSTSSMFIARASANALPARPSWTSRAPTSAKASAATPRRVSALKSKACAAPEHPSASSAISRARRPDQRSWDQSGCRRMGGSTSRNILQAGGLNCRLRTKTKGVNTWGSEQGKRAVRLSLGYCTATRLLFRLHGGRQLAALRDRPPKVPINARLGGEAYFALAMEWRLWRGLRSFPRRPL